MTLKTTLVAVALSAFATGAFAGQAKPMHLAAADKATITTEPAAEAPVKGKAKKHAAKHRKAKHVAKKAQ